MFFNKRGLFLKRPVVIGCSLRRTWPLGRGSFALSPGLCRSSPESLGVVDIDERELALRREVGRRAVV